MSKWNKQPKPVSQDFLENQERRKQMIIESAKRRKEQQKRLQENEHANRKNKEQLLQKHKQQKKDAYIKYLKNNLHDKYQKIKNQQKQKQPEVKSHSKWKKKSLQKQNNLEALDLNYKYEKESIQNQSNNQNKQNKKNCEKRQKLSQQFEQEWDFEESLKQQLLASKLLDSLDLDIDTLNRQNYLKKMIKKTSQDQAIDQVRGIIGYESIVFTPNTNKTNQRQNNLKKEKISQKPKKQLNQVEVFNELKRKKEGKIFQWAIEEEQQAEDLFSNCSTRKKQPKALMQLNEQIRKNNKNTKKGLQPIKQNQIKKPNTSVQKRNQNYVIRKDNTKAKSNSREKPNQAVSQKVIRPNISKQIVKEKKRQKSIEKKQQSTSYSNFSKKKQSQVRQNAPKTSVNFSNEKQKSSNVNIRRYSKQKSNSNSRQKKQIAIAKQPQIKKADNKFDSCSWRKPTPNLPPLPKQPQYQNSQATHHINFEIQSFMNNQILQVNQIQAKTQQQLKQFHLKNKNKVAQIYQKYDIKKNYKHSNQITDNYIPDQTQSNRTTSKQTQQQLEQSIQNLDNMLLRRQINSREGNDTIEQLSEQSSIKSIINPLSNPIQFHKQVLQLAENISRFENHERENDGQGYGNKKKARKQGGFSKKKEEQDLSESKNVQNLSQKTNLHQPPKLINSQKMIQSEEQEQKKEKISVNERLKHLLLQCD